MIPWGSLVPNQQNFKSSINALLFIILLSNKTEWYILFVLLIIASISFWHLLFSKIQLSIVIFPLFLIIHLHLFLIKSRPYNSTFLFSWTLNITSSVPPL